MSDGPKIMVWLKYLLLNVYYKIRDIVTNIYDLVVIFCPYRAFCVCVVGNGFYYTLYWLYILYLNKWNVIDLTGQFVIAHFMLHVQVCDLFNCCVVLTVCLTRIMKLVLIMYLEETQDIKSTTKTRHSMQELQQRCPT